MMLIEELLSVELETALETFTTVELIPPHKPLSDDIGMIVEVSDFAPGTSPNNRVRGRTSPRDFSIFICAPFSREAATIFIAAVIF